MTAAINIIWLAIQIAGLNPKAVTDYVTQLEYRVGHLEQRRQLHLVVRETGHDLGVSVDGGIAAWNEEHQVVIDYRVPIQTEFDGPNCTGKAYYPCCPDLGPLFNRYFFTGDGRLIRPASLTRSVWMNGSSLLKDGTCFNINGTGNGGTAVLIAPFTVPRFSPETLDLQVF